MTPRSAGRRRAFRVVLRRLRALAVVGGRVVGEDRDAFSSPISPSGHPTAAALGARSLLGAAETGRAAVDAAESLALHDMAAAARARAVLLSAPGDAVDSLILLALLMARAGHAGGDDAALSWLRWAADAATLELHEQEFVDG